MTAKEYFMEMCGYELKTTFWSDYDIADHFGINAIKDTFKRAFKSWKHNTEYITEMALVLNHKMWQHYEKKPEYGKTYQELWEQLDEWCVNNLKGNDLKYYYRVTD